MNFLDKFRYTYDDLNELGIVQNNKKETKNFRKIQSIICKVNLYEF